MNPNSEVIAKSFPEFADELLRSTDIKELFFALEMHINLNIILYCCWTAKFNNRLLSKNKIKMLLAIFNPWHKLITLPLIRLKERSKNITAQKFQAVIPLFEEKIIKSMHFEQRILADAVFDLNEEEDTKPDQQLTIACKNISNYLAELKIDLEKKDFDLIKRVIGFIFSDVDAEKLSKYLCTTKNTKRNKLLSYLQLNLSFFE